MVGDVSSKVKSMRKKKVKIIISSLILVVLGWIMVGYILSWYLTSRRNQISKRVVFQLPKKEILVTTEDGISISGWFIKGEKDTVVILLAGIGANRFSLINKAKLYYHKGFSILMPDLRATGKSKGDIISFGWNERKDLKACYEYLNNQGYKHIAAHGTSLGAATIVYSMQENLNFRFIVLESCYDNIDHAFNNRVSKYQLPDVAYLPVRYFTQLRINENLRNLNPLNFIQRISCPVLIMAGDSEDQLKLIETEALFHTCGSQHKNLHIFKGGKHEDFLKRFPTEYNNVLDYFLSQNH